MAFARPPPGVPGGVGSWVKNAQLMAGTPFFTRVPRIQKSHTSPKARGERGGARA